MRYFTWVIALIIGLLALLSVGKFYVVGSGSMEPKIKTGSLIYDQKEKEYKVGDVITYRIVGSNNTGTHRVVEIITKNGRNSYRVKGDANNASDLNLIEQAYVVGKVRWAIPYLGYLVAFSKTLPGLILLIIIPAMVVIYGEIKKK